MIKMVLKEHGISLGFPVDVVFEDTEKGLWLKENNIDYRVIEFEDIVAMNIDGNLHDAIIVERIDFFNEEDFTAFKLRWSD